MTPRVLLHPTQDPRVTDVGINGQWAGRLERHPYEPAELLAYAFTREGNRILISSHRTQVDALTWVSCVATARYTYITGPDGYPLS